MASLKARYVTHCVCVSVWHGLHCQRWRKSPWQQVDHVDDAIAKPQPSFFSFSRFFLLCVCVCRVVARCRFRSQRRRDVIETSAVGGRLGQWRATDDVVSAPRPENVASRHALASSLVFLSLFLSFFLSFFYFFFFFFSFPDPLCRNDQSGRCCVEGSTTRVLPDCNLKKKQQQKTKAERLCDYAGRH